MDQETISRLPEDTAGRRMKKLRLKAGLTQEKLSEYLGFSPNYYGQVERGRRELSKSLANALCCYFGVTYSYLYQGIRPDQLREEEEYDTCKNRLIRYLETCSEEECSLIYPVLQLLIQNKRNWETPAAARQEGKRRAGRPRKVQEKGQGRKK